MWSGPRNISTAMMRAFENRADTVVVDEPLYAALPARDRHRPPRTRGDPGRPGRRLAARHRRADRPRPRRTRGLLPEAHDPPPAPADRPRLARPASPTRSSSATRPAWSPRTPGCAASPRWTDLGFPQQAEIFRACADAAGTAPPVVDAADVLAAPRAVLAELLRAASASRSTRRCCRGRPGRAPTDGVWAPHWYAVGRGDRPGSGRRRPGPPEVPDHLRGLLDRCRPYYDELAPHRIRAPPRRGPRP